MGYSNFRLQIILRVLGITVSLFLAIFMFFILNFSITPILMLVLCVGQVVALIHYVEKTNRYLTTFLEAIRFSDFSQSFYISGLGKSYDELRASFDNVMKDFVKIRGEKEEHQQYLQNVIQHIGISLVAFQRDGTIELINNSAKKLLRVNNLKNINQISSFSPDLTEKIKVLKSGERQLVKVEDNNDILQLSIYAKEFKLGPRFIKLISLQNIKAELEEQEMAAWQKLIRVLTHEIMNSITPISSLSSTVNHILSNIDTTDNKPQEIDDETIIDIQDAIRTIHKRSLGLTHFVESYRDLTRIPAPTFRIFSIQQLFHNIEKLLEEDMKANGINFLVEVKPVSLELTADEQLIEQILINLIKNAIHASVECEKPTIRLKAEIGQRGRTVLHVCDNGTGIVEDVIDKIFIPFFTTKPSGSGIGLSLSRQIMRLHGGTISVTSDSGCETKFTLTF